MKKLILILLSVVSICAFANSPFAGTWRGETILSEFRYDYNTVLQISSNGTLSGSFNGSRILAGYVDSHNQFSFGGVMFGVTGSMSLSKDKLSLNEMVFFTNVRDTFTAS